MIPRALETGLVPPSAAHRGARIWQAALVVIMMAVLYGPVLADLAHDWWTEPGLSYGLLLPVLAVYVAFAQRRRTLALPLQPGYLGLSCIGAACLLYVVGQLGAESFLPRMSFPLLVAGLVWTYCGAAWLRSLAFPLLLLGTMVPLPALIYNSVALPLQLLASNLGAEVARWFGVVILREGNILHLARMSLGVEEACSGLNSLSALMVTSLCLGFLYCRSVTARVMLFLFWAPIAILVNVIRVAMTAVLADFNRDFALGFYHAFSSVFVFALAVAMLAGVAAGLNFIFRREPRT